MTRKKPTKKPPPKTRSKGTPDLSGKGAVKVRRRPHQPDVTKPHVYGAHKGRVREYYGQLLRDEQLPNAIAFVNRCLATVDPPQNAAPGALRPFLDPGIDDAIRIRAAQLVIEHAIGKPKQHVELDATLTTAWITEAHVLGMNNAASLALGGNRGDDVEEDAD